MSDRKPNAVSCFAWHWASTSPPPGDVVKRGTDLIPPYAACHITGLLNPIATEDPILICDSLLMETHDGGAGSLVVINGPSWVKQREPFTGFLPTHPVWAKYHWPDALSLYWPDGEDTEIENWPKYWQANPFYEQWSLVPYEEGIGLSGLSGLFLRIGRPDMVRKVICVMQLSSDTIVEVSE